MISSHKFSKYYAPIDDYPAKADIDSTIDHHFIFDFICLTHFSLKGRETEV